MKKKILIAGIFCFIIISIFVVVATVKLYEYQITSNDGNQVSTTTTWYQTFRIGTVGDNETFVLSNVSLNGSYNGGGNVKTVWVSIFATNASGSPTGNPLAISYPKSVGDFPLYASKSWGNFSFPIPPTLTKGEQYAIYVNTTGILDSTFIWYSNVLNPYSGGLTYRADGCLDGIEPGCISRWDNVEAGWDMVFMVYGEYIDASNITVNLDAPINNSKFVRASNSFNASYVSGTDLQNATYYVWNSTGRIYNDSVTSVITGTTNSTSETISNLIVGNYSWNVLACSTNYCKYAENNFTFGRESLIENSQTYNATTSSGNSETFLINLTYDSSTWSSITSVLYYNNTAYTGTKTGTGDNILFSRLIDPFATVLTNHTFYWTVSLINSTATLYLNSTSYNQTVSSLLIDDCASYTTLLLNYTVKDELTQNYINSSVNETNIELNIGIYSSTRGLILNLSELYNNTNNAKVCINSSVLNSTYLLYSEAKYSANGYVIRYNYIQNFSLMNSTIPQHITLFDLPTSEATKFLMTYKGVTFLAVPNALISINRRYVSENSYKTVEVGKTDNYGQTTGWFDLDAKYQIIVTKEGQILSTFSNVAVFCENELTGDCKISLDASSALADVIDFYTLHNFAYSQDFNETTRTHTLIFSTLDGSVSTISTNLTRLDMYFNTTVCSNQISTSSGTLTCAVPASYGNLTFVAVIYKDGRAISYTPYVIRGVSGAITFAGNLVIFVVGIILSIAVMFIPSAIGVIIGTLIGTIIATYFFLINNPILGGAFAFLVVVGVVLIWKMRQAGGD